MRAYKTLILACLALPLLAACEKSPREKLQGKWKGIRVERLSGPAAQKAEGWAKQTTVEFSGNNVTIMIPAEPSQSGTFQVAKAEGDHMTVNFKRADKSRDDSSEFRFTQDGKLVWSLGSADVVLQKAVD